MNIPISARDFPSKISAAEDHDEIALLGGEPLEGSGFEAQDPEPNFQFDLAKPLVQSQGGWR